MLVKAPGGERGAPGLVGGGGGWVKRVEALGGRLVNWEGRGGDAG